MYLIMVVLGVLSWPGICHLIRAQILSQREQEYVTAAQALGVREKSIIFHHIIPNVMSLILVNATLSFATCMLTESSLSYMGFGISPETSKLIGIVTVVVLVTYFSIVFGELVPKRLGQVNPETVACRVSGSLKLLSVVMSPFVKLLSVSTEGMLKLFGQSGKDQASVTEEVIHAMIEEGSESGVIDMSERDMVRNVFRLDDRQVGSLMTPRADIEWIDLEDSQEENVRKVQTSMSSRLIVASGSLDDIKGYCTTRSLLQQMLEGGKPDFMSNLTPATYVPESLSGMELLEQFKVTDTQLALVVDEYGGVVGLVTPRDLLEAIAGEFKPATTDDAWAVPRNDGSWFLDGIIPVPELKDCLQIKAVPEEEQGRYNTLSGMMMVLLARLPKTGDAVSYTHLTLPTNSRV